MDIKKTKYICPKCGVNMVRDGNSIYCNNHIPSDIDDRGYTVCMYHLDKKPREIKKGLGRPVGRKTELELICMDCKQPFKASRRALRCPKCGDKHYSKIYRERQRRADEY